MQLAEKTLKPRSLRRKSSKQSSRPVWNPNTSLHAT